MIEVISVKGNSVRIRSGIFVVDIPVTEHEDGSQTITIHKGAYYIAPDNFRRLVAAVLQAYRKSKSIHVGYTHS